MYVLLVNLPYKHNMYKYFISGMPIHCGTDKNVWKQSDAPERESDFENLNITINRLPCLVICLVIYSGFAL